MKRIFIFIFPLLLLTGCSSESLADRTYTRALGVSERSSLVLSMQGFGEDESRTVKASDIPEAIRLAEARAGGRIFVGHTELLCLDGTTTLETVKSLFYEQCLSPGCKVLYTSPEQFLKNSDTTEAVHSLRMAEKNGLLPSTDLSTILDEWLGAWETALLPSSRNGLVLLHKDGTVRMLSDEAASGMYWLRRNKGSFSVSVGEHAEEIKISGIRLTRTAQENAIRYSIHIRTRDCPRNLLRPLEEMVLSQAEAAASEMLAAHADVIGMQEALEAAGIRVDTETMPEVFVSVSVE